MRRLLLVGFAAAVLFAVIAPVTAHAIADTTPTFESKYFVIETELPMDRAKFIGQVMDATGKEYDRRFAGFSRKIQKKQRVRVFPSQELYVEGLKKITVSDNKEFTGGLFNHADETVYTFDGPGLERTLKHECFHQFAHGVVGGALPLWVNEGLAEYFECGEFDAKSGVLRLGSMHPEHPTTLKLGKSASALMPLETVMKITGQEWSDNMAGPHGPLQYAQSWALCHLFVHAENGRYGPMFESFLKQLDKGVDGDTAFKKVFGADLKPLVAKYNSYMDEMIAKAPEPKKSENRAGSEKAPKKKSP